MMKWFIQDRTQRRGTAIVGKGLNSTRKGRRPRIVLSETDFEEMMIIHSKQQDEPVVTNSVIC